MNNAMSTHPRPPEKAVRFLRWFCREDFVGEFEGDLSELFYLRAQATTPAKARWLFWMDVFRSFRPANFKRFGFTLFSTGMYKNYLVTSLRNFARHKSSFLINLTGLSTGLACTLLILLWVQDEFSYDKFYPEAGNMYKVMGRFEYANNISVGDWSPGPLGNHLGEEYPDIAYATVCTWEEPHLISYGDKNISASGRFGGKDFFSVFQLQSRGGDLSQAFAEPNTIALSRSLAEKLFGSENALGKDVQFNLDNTYKVTAIYEDFPANSSIKAEWVSPIDGYFYKYNRWATNWGNYGPKTFVRLRDGADAQAVTSKIRDIPRRMVGDTTSTFLLYPFTDSYLYGTFENGEEAGGRIEYVRLFGAIAAFILCIACINFMNLTTARATRRAKEIGIRKAIGARRSQLVSQFFFESFLVTTFSAVLGLLLVALILPYFNQLTDKQIQLQPGEPGLYGYLLLIVLTTALLSGSYPAFYLASFKVVKILKGAIKGSGGEVFVRRGLVIVQFALSVLLIIATAVVYQQVQYINEKNLGYNKENLLFFSADEEFLKYHEVFGNEVKKINGVLSVSGSNHKLLGHASSNGNVQWEGKSADQIVNFETIRTDYDFLKTIGIDIVEGRDFSREFATDTARLIVNETAVRIMGLTEPLGAKVKLWGADFEIVGVAKDFHFSSIHKSIEPAIITLEPGTVWIYWIRISGHNISETLAEIDALYKQINPEYPFQYRFQDQALANLYVAEQRIGTLSTYFALFAILISALGLFGLSTYMAEKRKKEIGIRKVLGASVSQLVAMLTRDFTVLVAASIVIATPFAYYLTSMWLDGFEYHIRLNFWYFACAAVLALAVAFFTISIQSLKAASANPAHSLRNNE